MAGFPTVNGTQVFALPPDGVQVNFDNPRQQYVMQHYLIYAIGGPLALVALCQRFYTKLFLSKGLQVDDAFMFLAWASSIITQTMLVVSISEGGMCAHNWEMPLERYSRYSLTIYVTAPIFTLCNGFTKLSLLAFYLHLSRQTWFRISVWVSVGIVTCYTAAISLAMFFQCDPVRSQWDFEVTGQCIDAGVLYIATAVANIITDIILFVLPIPMVLGLRMGVAQKIGAIVVFGIGSVTVATSCVRLGLLPATLKSTDPSWDAAPADIWTFLEANLFIICGSTPTLRKFFKHIAPKLMGSSANDSYARSYGKYGPDRSGLGGAPNRLNRRTYEQFPGEAELNTFSPAGNNSNEELGMVSKAEGVNNKHQRDDSSDRAILQTKSFAIQYGRAS